MFGFLFSQHGREVVDRDLGASDAVGQQPRDTISTHRPARRRFNAHDRECGRRKHAVEEGDEEAQHRQIYILRCMCMVHILNRVGSAHIRIVNESNRVSAKLS